MSRLSNWRPALLDYLRSVEARPFHKDSWNCAHFANGAILAQTGVDEFSQITKAKTFKGQWKAIRRKGWSDWPAAFAERHITIGDARIGDIAVLEGLDGNAAAGVILGPRVRAFGPNGQALVARSAALYGISV